MTRFREELMNAEQRAKLRSIAKSCREYGEQIDAALDDMDGDKLAETLADLAAEGRVAQVWLGEE